MSEYMEKPHVGAVAEDAALYALGVAGPRDRKNVEARLKSHCPLCEAEVAACSGTLADLAGVLPIAPVAPPAGLRSRLMNYVAGERETGRDMHVVRGNEVPWVAGPVPGATVKPFDGAKSFLLRLEAGITLPAHDHEHGSEQCLVLEGSATAAGVKMTPGDFVSMPHGSFHEDFISGPDGCVLFISYK